SNLPPLLPPAADQLNLLSLVSWWVMAIFRVRSNESGPPSASLLGCSDLDLENLMLRPWSKSADRPAVTECLALGLLCSYENPAPSGESFPCFAIGTSFGSLGRLAVVGGVAPAFGGSISGGGGARLGLKPKGLLAGVSEASDWG